MQKAHFSDILNKFCSNSRLERMNRYLLFLLFLGAFTGSIVYLWCDTRRLSALFHINGMRYARSKYATKVSNLSCDSECLLLRSELTQWPENKPKAFIYYLTRHARLGQLLDSLSRLDNYFNNKYQYPIIIFHELEPTILPDRLIIRSRSNSTIYFQTVNFTLPYFIPKNFTQQHCVSMLGYRHMCRFHAKGIYDQPIIEGFEYAWRLDDDSKIRKPVFSDLFIIMQKNRYKYGYVRSVYDRPPCIRGLWETCQLYITNFSINTTFFREVRSGYCFSNNFEISQISFWLSDNYRKYIDYIDKTSGIYYNRWGDAPIKTIAVSMFVPKSQVYKFPNISYSHQSMRVNT